MVDVEQGGLSAFQQHDPALIKRLVEHQPGVSDVAVQSLRVSEVLLGHGVGVDAPPVVDLGQDLVLFPQGELKLLLQNAGIEQVLHADADPGGLVGVGRADAAAGRADPGVAEVALGDLIQRDVVRHDQVRIGRDQQPVPPDAALDQAVDLLEQDLRVDHDPVADHRGRVLRQGPRREQVQRVAFVADDHGVPGVVAALIADDVVNPVAEQVGGLALAFIAPLRADDHDGGHVTGPSRNRTKAPCPRLCGEIASAARGSCIQMLPDRPEVAARLARSRVPIMITKTFRGQSAEKFTSGR